MKQLTTAPDTDPRVRPDWLTAQARPFDVNSLPVDGIAHSPHPTTSP